MPLPLIAPLLLKFPLLGRLPWRWIGIGAAVLAVGVVYVKHRNDLIEAGRAEVRAEQKAAEELATQKHNDRLAEVEDTYDAKLTTLQAERDAALARPATRTIRVPVSAVCPAPGPSDAGVPEADPGHRLLEIDDPGYGRFQDWLTEFAGAAEAGG